MKSFVSLNMLNELITKYGHSTASIAKKTGVTKKTIDRIINKRTRPSIKTENNLISFYCYCMVNSNPLEAKHV